MKSSKATCIKLLFAAVLLWQPVQYFFTYKFGEAYPFLQLPTFRGTLTDSAGNIRLDAVDIEVSFKDNTKEIISQQTLLRGVPSAYQSPIMNHMFAPVTVKSEPPKGGPWQKAKLFLFPGLVASRARVNRKEVDPETRRWLERRLVELYPGTQPASVAFVWHADIYTATSAKFTVSHEPLGVREVSFAEAP